MRCFTCCFRIRDDHRSRINRDSHPITVIAKEPVDVDPLASGCVWSVVASAVCVCYSEEDRDISQHEDGRYHVAGSPVLDDELRAEVTIFLMFLLMVCNARLALMQPLSSVEVTVGLLAYPQKDFVHGSIQFL
ncbi:hypothetical protein HanHA300_Chr12g0439821 [Helianthus annuus]|nr:hypothetical protein HanHA300_Chr12g0439821 [Helianthus annuus]KAJ0504946.1 hypothetical protein HanHA89_Chr12g0464931 [Helianthus annuus]KAJ0674639.1 hypothetical protein HanLR1_Chr12g0442151 [Helianthus annuus]